KLITSLTSLGTLVACTPIAMTACSNNANDTKLEITIGSGSQTVEVGYDATWTINLSYDGAEGTELKKLEATSSDTTIATVTVADETKNSLKITGVAKGDAKINVTVTDSEDHKNSKEFDLTVAAASVHVAYNLAKNTYWDDSAKALYLMDPSTASEATLSVKSSSATFEITSPSTLPTGLSIDGSTLKLANTYTASTSGQEISVKASTGETLTFKIYKTDAIASGTPATTFGTETSAFSTGSTLSGALSNGDKLDLTAADTPNVSKPLVSDGTNVLTAGTDYSLSIKTGKTVTFEVKKAASFGASKSYFIAFTSGSTLAWFSFATKAA
ncbi:MAG: Ig-like domain-containing protein, partial [Malacoplasma sp.]|nr:Ig-like domain-containing protein [Malacoplasma sp.]